MSGSDDSESLSSSSAVSSEGEVIQSGNEIPATSSWPRYQGQPRKYRRLIHAEQDLYDSVESIESADLSIHLYNAHALKCRLHNEGQRNRDWKSRSLARRWQADGEDNNWAPGRSWTAWPLDPDGSQAAQVRYDWNGGGVKRFSEHEISKSTQIPSEALENCLLSEVLKSARSAYREDQVKDDHVTLPRKRNRKSKLDTGGNDTNLEKQAPAKPSSFRADCITTDEEEARSIAIPVLRHMISQFEGLLRSLSLSRRNQQAKIGSGSESEGKSEAEDSGSSTRSAYRRRISREAMPRDWGEVIGLAALTGWDDEAVERAATRCKALFEESKDFSALYGDPTGPQHSALNVPDDFRCPVRDCKRHSIPYPARYRLNEHMKRKHGGTIATGQQSESSQRVVVNSLAAAHVDGYLQPIRAPTHWRSARTYSRRPELVPQKRKHKD